LKAHCHGRYSLIITEFIICLQKKADKCGQNGQVIFPVCRFALVLHYHQKINDMLLYTSAGRLLSKGFHHDEGLNGMCPITCRQLFNHLNQFLMAKTNYSKRVATDPAFERTRENMAEFERAGKAGKLLTDAFRVLANSASDSRLQSRLSKEMSKVIKADLLNDRGQRNVTDGNIRLLHGFDFNVNAKLSTVFFAPYTAAVDRAAGTLSINIPGFIPKSMVNGPVGVTHFSVACAVAALDFTAGTYTNAHASTAEMVYGDQVEQPIALSGAIAPGSTGPLFLALGIRFYQQVNNKFYTLNNGAYNALCLVAVDVPAA
jgi:hypothetical protein